MHCFRIVEKVEEGLIVRYPFLVVGDEREKHRKLMIAEDDRAWLNAMFGIIREGEKLLFLRGELAGSYPKKSFSLIPEDGKESHPEWALVLVQTMPGEGGKLELRNNSYADIITKGFCCGVPEYLMLMRAGGLVHIRRSGDLQGGRPDLFFGWDGQRLQELHETVKPSCTMVA